MSLTRRWTVYQHVNLVNGKRYIGITSQKPSDRWGYEGRGYREGQHFSSAIKKYGWQAFSHEVLYTDLSQEEAERLEVELIARYQTQDPHKGYNVASGGLASTLTEGTKQKISKANKGRVLSEETKRRIGAASARRKASAETRAKLSANSAKARRVRCVETDRVYPSANAAARDMAVQQSKITLCCQGKRRTTGGYHWEYFDTPIFDTQDFCRKEVKENDRQV